MRLKTLRATVGKMREDDPETAVSVSMLNRLIDVGQIPFERHGNRKIVDYDELNRCFRTLLALDYHATMPHIRSIDGALAEVRETMPELGISEERLRELIKTSTVSALRVGNRSYIPMELFHPPYDRRLAKDCYGRAERMGGHYRYKSYAEEQLDELLSSQAKAAEVKRAG